MREKSIIKESDEKRVKSQDCERLRQPNAKKSKLNKKK